MHYNYKNIVAPLLIAALLLFGGCAGMAAKDTSLADPSADSANTATDKAADEIKIKEFSLSPGDELKISVYQHEELTRSTKISPDGIIFYPLVGEIDTKGKSLKILRDLITEGLSRYQEQALLPGDEISITVFRNDEYNRKFIIPSDGSVFFPNIGTIKVEGESPDKISKIISAGLSNYLVNPQVIVDIVKFNNPVRIVNPQVSVEVVAFGGQKIFVLGEVNKPGVFLADGNTTIVEIITMAGGPTLDAKQNNVLLIRNGKDKTKPELQLVDIESILSQGNTVYNLILQRGDIVFVPRTLIANVDRFFEHLGKIVSPLLDIETGYWTGQNIEIGPERGRVSR